MSTTAGTDSGDGKLEAQYRVFISYSHDDKDIAQAVAEHLEKELGAVALWDPMVQPGSAFSDDLKEMIAFAHVFLPILTVHSNSRPWVHQEIGYATALGLSILPLAFGELPLGMADRVQALKIPLLPQDATPERVAQELLAHFRAADLANAVARRQGAQTSIAVLCAPYHEDRTLMLIEHFEAVLKHNPADVKGVRIRHEAPFGTLSLPNMPPDALVWRCRDGENRRSDWLRSRYRRERQLAERHALDGGCDLIVHPGRPDDASMQELWDSDPVRAQLRQCSLRTRLTTLVEFITSMRAKGAHCRVVVSEEGNANNTLIVGDWFVAETITRSRRHGLRHTIITRHAPTVSERMAQFDADFAALLGAHGLTDVDSSARALELLQERLNAMDAEPCRRDPPEPCPLRDLNAFLDAPLQANGGPIK